MQFSSINPKYEYLRKKWVGKNRTISNEFLQKHESTIRHLTLGGLSGLVLLGSSGVPLAQAVQNHTGQGITFKEDKGELLASDLKEVVPEGDRSLTAGEEEKISQILSARLGIKAEAELSGIRLNRSYGLIGGEQHLYRYSGDTLFKHAQSATDWAMFGSSGIATGLGAWGYFAPSEQAMSKLDYERERYYIAVQTFLAPGFAENVGKYRDFFKYRKMAVVNPKTGQAVICDIADAGPSEWTGKHLGGSPEVMHLLSLGAGARKGKVLYFFVDDPKDEVPLGPIDVR